MLLYGFGLYAVIKAAIRIMNFRGILLPELFCKIIFEGLFLGLKVWTDASLFTGPYIIILCLVYTSTTLEHISDSSCHFYMALKPFTRKRPESFGLLGHTSKWAVRVYMYLSSSSFLYSANGEVFPSPRAGVLHYEVKKTSI